MNFEPVASKVYLSFLPRIKYGVNSSRIQVNSGKSGFRLKARMTAVSTTLFVLFGVFVAFTRYDLIIKFPREKMKNFVVLAWEIFKVFVISLAIIIPIRYFLIQPFFVHGASMEPNFEDGQYLIIDEISYKFREPARGEVVVFRYPLDTKEFFIKRIIGLPGETVEIHGNKITIINKDDPQGLVLDEGQYLQNVPLLGDETITLKDNEFFVMGDNRSASFDSRRWGPVPKDDLVGRVWIRAWPVNQTGIIKAPGY